MQVVDLCDLIITEHSIKPQSDPGYCCFRSFHISMFTLGHCLQPQLYNPQVKRPVWQYFGGKISRKKLFYWVMYNTNRFYCTLVMSKNFFYCPRAWNQICTVFTVMHYFISHLFSSASYLLTLERNVNSEYVMQKS